MIEICYSTNPIKDAIVRIDFISSIEQFNTEIPNELLAIIKDIFPIPESREVIARELKISNEGVDQKENKIKEWTFHNKERNRRLTLTKDSMIMNHSYYESYDKFHNDFIVVAEQIFKTYNIQVKRFGIRFINNINFDKGDVFNWSAYLNKDLLSIFNIPDKKSLIARAFHNLELNYGDYNLRFQYGMHNPDYPAPIKKKVFILDFDSYTVGILNKDDIEAYFIQFHKSIQDLFESSITEKYRKIIRNE